MAVLAVWAESMHGMREQLQNRPSPRPAATPIALRVRQLASAATDQPSAAPEVPAVGSGPASAPRGDPEPAIGAEPVSQTGVGLTGYVPRPLLSVPPVARAPVLLDWPPNWPFRTSFTAVLKLYLDEQGRVERVEPDGDAALPGPLFDAARQAFVAAGFTPGQLNGQAVKSWIRVEVSFESGAPASSP